MVQTLKQYRRSQYVAYSLVLFLVTYGALWTTTQAVALGGRGLLGAFFTVGAIMFILLVPTLGAALYYIPSTINEEYKEYKDTGQAKGNLKELKRKAKALNKNKSLNEWDNDPHKIKE